MAMSEAQIVKTLLEAVKENDADAQHNLGLLYAYGRLGLKQDEKQACLLYIQAGKKGHPGAQYSLGIMCLNGRGVKKSDEKAFLLFQMAKKQGHVRAQCYLAWMYMNGRGVDKDDGQEANDKKAFLLYKELAEQNCLEAQYMVAWMYAHGRGVTQDKKQARTWYEEAAVRGHVKAETKLTRLRAKESSLKV